MKLDPLALPRPPWTPLPSSTASPGCVSEQAAGTGERQGVPWGSGRGAGAGGAGVGGQQVQNNGVPRGGPGSRCCPWGVQLSLFPSSGGPKVGGGSLWVPGPPWLMLRGHQDAGHRHTARPLPWVPAALPGCHDNQHFHPCPFVWSRSSFCDQP